AEEHDRKAHQPRAPAHHDRQGVAIGDALAYPRAGPGPAQASLDQIARHHGDLLRVIRPRKAHGDIARAHRLVRWLRHAVSSTARRVRSMARLYAAWSLQAVRVVTMSPDVFRLNAAASPTDTRHRLNLFVSIR